MPHYICTHSARKQILFHCNLWVKLISESFPSNNSFWLVSRFLMHSNILEFQLVSLYSWLSNVKGRFCFAEIGDWNCKICTRCNMPGLSFPFTFCRPLIIILLWNIVMKKRKTPWLKFEPCRIYWHPPPHYRPFWVAPESSLPIHPISSKKSKNLQFAIVW